MAILTESLEKPAQIQAVREVRLGMPLERGDEMRDFYTRLIGLCEWPPPRQIPGGWGAGHPRRGAYFIFRHDAQVDPLRRRVAIHVPSLESVQERLRQAGRDFVVERGLGRSDSRVLVADPVGHLVELRQLQPL